MNLAISTLVGFFLGLVANDFAAQALNEKPLRPLAGSCSNCGTNRGWNRIACPNCERKPWRDIVVAMAAAGMAMGVYVVFGPSWALIPYAGFVLLTAALTITDIDAMRIVDRLNIRGSAILILVLGVTSLLDDRFSDFLRGLSGGGAYFAGAFLLFLLVRGNGFGAGDVKLAPLLGVFTAYLGWDILGRAVFSTAIIGGVLALFAIAFMAAKRKTELPYGPAMVLGSWVAIWLAGIGT